MEYLNYSNINIFLSYNTEKQQTHERRFLWIEFNTRIQLQKIVHTTVKPPLKHYCLLSMSKFK